ncbi:MAG: hypothetical protein J5787_02010 [Alphaproteobacteria bacterium]|nr:hypothetical protein [Alphaproteobacteria bacterium]MBO4643165.1 hypothetical protein [Alphaproteobacteria bacterium]
MRHCPFLFKTVQAAFDNLPIVMSLSLHLLAVFLLTYDFSSESKSDVVSVPMFVVDLSQVKVAEITNLPPKLTKSASQKTGKKSVRTSAYSKASAQSAKPESRGGAKSGSGGKKQSSGAMLENDLNKMLKSVTTAPKKAEAPSDVQMVNSVRSSGTQSGGGSDDPFKTLLASVDGIKSGMGYADAQTEAEVDADEIVTEGIEGGQGGSYMQELSVSEKDLIGIKLRECWNLDAGVRGVQNMLIEIRVFLDKDGTVKDAKILNKTKYNKDAAFRSVAESARRAVYICDKKNEESPFRLFSKNYEEAYDTWKTLLLRFNPFDGGVI